MEPIAKRLNASREEMDDFCGIEKKAPRAEFFSNIMAGHQHRISLIISKEKITGRTERVNGHVHKVDLPVVGGDILGFTSSDESHKHRINFRVKDLVPKKAAPKE